MAASASEILSELLALPRGDELARLVREAGARMHRGRSRDLQTASADLREAEGFHPGTMHVSAGDAVAALARSAPSAAERTILSALLARGVALAPPEGVDAEDRTVAELLWLSGHTPLDAFPALDAALGDRASGLWGALLELLRRIDLGREPSFDRADALAAALALGHATGSVARDGAVKLADEVTDPALRAALRPTPVAGGPEPLVVGDGETLSGELCPAPRPTWLTVVLALTGVLFVVGLARLFARYALQRRSPAEVTVRRDGVYVKAETTMLGKTVKQAEHVLPVGTLARATRDVRFPQLATYAGLAALLLGTYLGVSLFVDGARAASPSLLGQGVLLFAIGVGIELALTSIVPGVKGKVRLVFVPEKGGPVVVGGLDGAAADKILAKLRN